MGCGCLGALMAVAVPRFTLFLMWLFTDRLSIAFDSFIVGFLGFLLLPYTTVFYAIVVMPTTLNGNQVSGFGWILVAFGLVLDLSSWFGGGKAGRDRYDTNSTYA
jgi:hypothetical protein